MIVSFEVPGLPKSPNGRHKNYRAHAKHNREWRSWSASAASAAIRSTPGVFGSTPWRRVRVRCVRYSSMRMDFDNLVASFKPVIDGLQDAGLIMNDTDATVVSRSYSSLPEAASKGRIYVMVERVDDEEVG